MHLRFGTLADHSRIIDIPHACPCMTFMTLIGAFGLQLQQNTMNSFPRLVSGLARRDGAWICTNCAKSTRKSAATPFFKPSIRRTLHDTSKPRQNVAPTMEQLRAPFAKKNTSTLFYTISVIMGTVALSYGSVPMYKMVRLCLLTPPPI